MYTVLGSCSICGGRVIVPTVSHSVVPPVPSCESCGATQKLPEIQMEPHRKTVHPIPGSAADIQWKNLPETTSTGKKLLNG